MKFTLSWLKQHLETDAPLDAIAAKLTALGLEVEGIADRGRELAPFIVAKIVSAEKHPNADRLKVCVVDTGKEKVNVVCGASNARAGLVGVFAPPGTIIPASGTELKKGVIRGAESNGMMCSAEELKLPEDIDGIIELPDNAPLGVSYTSYAHLDDPVIELNLTPNRPDCAGVRGVARDLAAAGMGTLKPQAAAPVAGTFKSTIAVTLDFPDAAQACPHFTGRLIKNIENRPSPAWLQDKLRAIGQRPISALVDITNYLSFDQARPLHVFDAKKLKGNIVLRHARAGENLAALNDKTYDLPSQAVVIADDSGAISLGGIMGGIGTACDEKTTDVFLESAWFHPAAIARAGRELQIISDARYRFERGVDPASTAPGLELATKLILELCGTPQTQVSETVIAGVAPLAPRAFDLRPERCKTLVGVDVPAAEQKRILSALGFDVSEAGGKIRATAPSWRPDIMGEADLVEEIIRVYGYDHIPAAKLMPAPKPAGGVLTALQRRVSAARRALAAQGLLESVTWSFMPSSLAAEFMPTNDNLRLVNPISADLDMMRPSILGNLMQALKRNADRGFPDLGLFEVGPVYHGASDDGQKTVAAILRAGHTPRHWAAPQRAMDVFDAKADALAALAACGVKTEQVQITADAPGYYHPGRSGSVKQGNNVLATFGEIHPRLMTLLDSTQPMAGAEIWLGNIPAPKTASHARPALTLEPLQPVRRDFAFVVDAAVTADKIAKAVRQADKNLITDVDVFDVYAGKGVEPGKKSLALAVTLQPRGQSLTDEQLEQVSSVIVTAVAKGVGGTLRG